MRAFRWCFCLIRTDEWINEHWNWQKGIIGLERWYWHSWSFMIILFKLGSVLLLKKSQKIIFESTTSLLFSPKFNDLMHFLPCATIHLFPCYWIWWVIYSIHSIVGSVNTEEEPTILLMIHRHDSFAKLSQCVILVKADHSEALKCHKTRENLISPIIVTNVVSWLRMITRFVFQAICLTDMNNLFFVYAF